MCVLHVRCWGKIGPYSRLAPLQFLTLSRRACAMRGTVTHRMIVRPVTEPAAIFRFCVTFRTGELNEMTYTRDL